MEYIIMVGSCVLMIIAVELLEKIFINRSKKS